MPRSASATAAGIAPMPIWMRRAVGHELGDVLADAALDVADRRASVLVWRLIDLDP